MLNALPAAGNAIIIIMDLNYLLKAFLRHEVFIYKEMMSTDDLLIIMSELILTV